MCAFTSPVHVRNKEEPFHLHSRAEVAAACQYVRTDKDLSIRTAGDGSLEFQNNRANKGGQS